ncbi:type II secretion system protein [bacterium]|nr:type II secretion system protein [bacterium]
MKKLKKAFTLAEVLITLGVIGVVASITLPTLIKEYNKHAWVNALKQNYSLLNQGFKKMMADDGVEFIADTEVWRAIGGSYSCNRDVDISSDYCKDFYAQLKKYFKIVRIGKGILNYSGINGSGETYEATVYKYKYRNSSSENIYWYNIIYLSNGAMIWDYSFYKNPSITSNCDAIHTAGGHMCGQAGEFYIDVNGNRGPNEFGKDIFYFYITERGQLAPYGGNDYAVLQASNSNFYGVGFREITQEDIDKYKANGSNGAYCDNTSRNGAGGSAPGKSCAGLLIDQLNWKMDY